jgi:hypothetical protein
LGGIANRIPWANFARKGLNMILRRNVLSSSAGFRGLAPVLLVLMMAAFPCRADFLGTNAINYALLFEGAGGNTLQITNVTINGNVGVGGTGQATDSGPSIINGRIDFSAADTGQFSNNNAGNVITGGVHYNVAAVTSALNYINNTSLSLFSDAGTSVAITGTQTINASAGALFTVNGEAVHVFDATSFTNGGGQTLTINGSATDLVAINLDGLGNIQFHGGIVFTGGITSDNVVFNLGGGNYTTMTGAASLDINNNGGAAGIAQGIFLDPNGAISVVNADVLGRVFGGDSHDFQYVSGSSITSPTPTPPTVPEPTSIVLLGSLLVITSVTLRKKRASRS